MPVLNTRLVSIDHFAIEVRSFSSSFIHVSFLFILQLQYKVESSAYCMQLLFGVMLDISAIHGLNKIGPSIEPCLTVRRDEQFESICTKCFVGLVTFGIGLVRAIFYCSIWFFNFYSSIKLLSLYVKGEAMYSAIGLIKKPRCCCIQLNNYFVVIWETWVRNCMLLYVVWNCHGYL